MEAWAQHRPWPVDNDTAICFFFGYTVYPPGAALSLCFFRRTLGRQPEAARALRPVDAETTRSQVRSRIIERMEEEKRKDHLERAPICSRMYERWVSRSAGTNGYLLTLPHRAAPTPRSDTNPPHPVTIITEIQIGFFFSNLSFLVVESVLGYRARRKAK